jgi:hypothetical protein
VSRVRSGPPSWNSSSSCPSTTRSHPLHHTRRERG